MTLNHVAQMELVLFNTFYSKTFYKERLYTFTNVSSSEGKYLTGTYRKQLVGFGKRRINKMLFEDISQI